ncbi:MAG: DEAD/DEAH box helicase family protein [Lachnospiraceae bacterium]|jgi:superfamily II DNA or RNA helicase|nr:DEAD/DEAH box helicase family protein [Lachnospiraceae bacterium]
MKVKIERYLVKKRRKYLSELIEEEYMEWEGKKILISAPTGMGKTTFIIQVLLLCFRRKRGKILILCNRILLRTQYWSSLLGQFENYREIEQCVTVMTYQQLEEKVKNTSSIDGLLRDYNTIVCDECHFFYTDSGYNNYGTYVLLQAIACAGAAKTMIFMSATMEEVKPLIEQTLRNCMTILSRTGRNLEISDTHREILYYDYSELADYERFHCICVPDLKTVCGLLAESPKKSVIFIDNKEKGIELMELLIKTQKVDRRQIAVLNADNIDHESNKELIRNLTISHKLIPRILITTSVLDNGISIHDSDVGNVLIQTESKCSFLQMLGRVRAEDVDNCNLYFIKRTEKEFSRRRARYEWEMNNFKKLDSVEQTQKWEKYLYAVWDRKDEMMADFYRKALVWMRHDDQFYSAEKNGLRIRRGEANFYVNEFAKRNTEDMYMIENRFYALAMEDPLKVIYAQMDWIGKAPEELQVMESEYMKLREQEFIDCLLKVQNFTSDEMKEFKKTLVKEYRKEFFDDVLANNGTISSDKLQEICTRYGLKFEIQEDTEQRRKIYSIRDIRMDKGRKPNENGCRD